MNSNTRKFMISIHDGFVEYSMLLEVPANSSIHQVASAIRAVYNQPPPGIDGYSEETPLAMRQSSHFLALTDQLK